MNLATILGIYLLSLGPPGAVRLSPGVPAMAVLGFAGQEAASQEASPQQNQPNGPPPPASSSDSKTSQTGPRHKKKNLPCSNSPRALNPLPGKPDDSTNPTADTAGEKTASTNAASNGSTDATAASKNSAQLKPCPPPKKVVRNGGSEEPSIQLVGGSPAEQASQQRSTEQLTSATEENLKKISGRQLSANQLELVNQVKHYMDQCKTAVAAGDLESGHNLALKAHLLSKELIKP